MNHLGHIVLQSVFNSCGSEQCQARLHLAEDLLQTLLFLQKILLSDLHLYVELLQLFIVDNLHGKVKRTQALHGGVLAELINCLNQFFVLAAYLKALLNL